MKLVIANDADCIRKGTSEEDTLPAGSPARRAPRPSSRSLGEPAGFPEAIRDMAD